MSQFLSKEQAHHYQKSVSEISERIDKGLERAERLMSKEDLARYKKIVYEPIMTSEMKDLMIKYGLISQKNICPTKDPGGC